MFMQRPGALLMGILSIFISSQALAQSPQIPIAPSPQMAPQISVGGGGTQAGLRALEAEPSVREVQEAALQYFRVNRDQVNSMRTRAAWKALAPVTEISGGYTRSDLDEGTIMYEFSSTDPWVDRGAGGNAYEVRGKLSWNLPQLVFNAEELDVASLAGLMEGILKESTRLYFMRRRLQVDLILNPPKDQASFLTKRLRLEELTGLIDAMTGGWFQKSLHKAHKSANAPKGARQNAGR